MTQNLSKQAKNAMGFKRLSKVEYVIKKNTCICIISLNRSKYFGANFEMIVMGEKAKSCIIMYGANFFRCC